MRLRKWIESNYCELVEMTDNITRSSEESGDLLHCVLEQALEREEKLNDIPETEIKWWFSRVIYTNWNSKTSPYYYQYKKESSRYDNIDDYTIETENTDLKHKRWVEDKMGEIDDVLEDLHWFQKLLFQRYLYGKYSYNSLSEKTKIPVNTIATSIRNTKKLLVKRLNK
jgi:DNA-directed RNA polymerase specialized sigma24 family protein